jgi:hypothetical protein
LEKKPLLLPPLQVKTPLHLLPLLVVAAAAAVVVVVLQNKQLISIGSLQKRLRQPLLLPPPLPNQQNIGHHGITLGLEDTISLLAIGTLVKLLQIRHANQGP